MLSFDLHVHPGPSVAPRWGDGGRVWQSAADGGVRGFVWKAHEQHTVALCQSLPDDPVHAIASASLNPWAGYEDVNAAISSGALWLWGPTQTPAGEIGWDLPLPGYWARLADWLKTQTRPLILATGHLGAEGRRVFAELAAANEHLTCSITHALYVPLSEAAVLADSGCAFEVDAYTLAFAPGGRERAQVRLLRQLVAAGYFVYFTSDGGQAATGDPFAFGARILDDVSSEIGEEAGRRLGVDNPALLVERLRPEWM